MATTSYTNGSPLTSDLSDSRKILGLGIEVAGN